MPPHVLDLLLQLPRGPLLGALENHVLEEMRGAVGVVGLESAAGVDPDADGGGLGREVGLGSDAEAGGEGGDAGEGGGEDRGVVG